MWQVDKLMFNYIWISVEQSCLLLFIESFLTTAQFGMKCKRTYVWLCMTPNFSVLPFTRQHACFPQSHFWLLGEVQWSTLLLSSSKTIECIEVKRGAKHSIVHESQVVSNMSTLFPLFLWKLLFLLMVFLFSWSPKAIQRVKEIVLLRVHSEEQKKGGGDYEAYSWGHSGSNGNSMNSFSQLLLKLDDRYLLVFARTTKYMEGLHSGPASFNARYWRRLQTIFKLQYWQYSWSMSAEFRYIC